MTSERRKGASLMAATGAILGKDLKLEFRTFETLTVTAVTQPANGTVTLVGGGVSYTPDPDFFGTDTFTYTISDGSSEAGSAGKEGTERCRSRGPPAH